MLLFGRDDGWAGERRFLREGTEGEVCSNFIEARVRLPTDADAAF